MLTIMMHSFVICAMVSILWMLVGYSLAFTNFSPWIGGSSEVGLHNLGASWHEPFLLGGGAAGSVQLPVPESVFIFFQMTFAIITPAVISGSFADRMSFKGTVKSN